MSSTELVAAVQPLLPMDPGHAEQVMRLYQETTSAWLDANDWIGEPNGEDSFVKKSGWLKIKKAYGLSTDVTYENIERDADGNAVRARARVMATAPNGEHAEGDGGCSIAEKNFTGSPDKVAKAENDVPGTAVTRAMNRAISNLVAYGKVSAEEAGLAGDTPAALAQLPAWALYADAPAKAAAGNNLRTIIGQGGADPSTVKLVADAIKQECGGDIPQCVAMCIAYIHTALESAPAVNAEPVAPVDAAWPPPEPAVPGGVV